MEKNIHWLDLVLSAYMPLASQRVEVLGLGKPGSKEKRGMVMGDGRSIVGGGDHEGRSEQDVK